jgi:hypothetical protein
MRNRALNYVHFFKEFFTHASPRCANYGSLDGTPHGQAASVESLILFSNAVLDRFPNGRITVLDAGAGATTAFLCNEPRFDVMSCDPDADYLAEVIGVVTRMGLKPPTPVTIDQVTGADAFKFDACFYDYGTSERQPLLLPVADRCAEILYVDDCHDDQVNAIVCGMADWTRVVPYSMTKDEFGRIGALLRRTGGYGFQS